MLFRIFQMTSSNITSLLFHSQCTPLWHVRDCSLFWLNYIKMLNNQVKAIVKCLIYVCCLQCDQALNIVCINVGHNLHFYPAITVFICSYYKVVEQSYVELCVNLTEVWNCSGYNHKQPQEEFGFGIHDQVIRFLHQDLVDIAIKKTKNFICTIVEEKSNAHF